MEIKQAIHCLKNDYDEEVCEECDFYHDCTHETRADVARLAVNALEKQMPKKPNTGNDNGRERKCCPVCGCFYSPTSRYCSKCGQALNLED